MGIKVKQLDGNKEIIATYNSYAEAATTLGCNESTIRKAAKNGNLIFGKFFFADISPTIHGEIQINTPYELIPPVEFDNTPIDIQTTSVKILFLDIETAPIRAYTWGTWKQNIFPINIVTDWFIICWAAKWLGSDEIISKGLTSEEALQEDDNRIIRDLWEIMDQADIIIAHNGNKFDIPKINTRFLVNELMPPSPYKQIDTYLVASNVFGFTYNALNELAKVLGCAQKKKTEFSLWADCMIGSEEALLYMEYYCRGDIQTLYEVYVKLRPHIKGHPNLDLYQDNKHAVCPHCGKDSLYVLDGKYFYTQAVRYQTYRCNYCGSLSRAKNGTKYLNKKQISPIPR